MRARTFAIAAFALMYSSASVAALPDFVMNDQGGIIRCSRAITDSQVEFCAGEIDRPELDPAESFNCAEAEVDSEYDFCRIPYPRAK